MEDRVLSPDDLAGFAQHGYVRVPEAFARADALAIQDRIWAQLRDRAHIARGDRTTWPGGAWQGLRDEPALERGIAGPRLCAAIDQLLGPGAWRLPDRWGGFLITFPTGTPETWALTKEAWHWDDTLSNHFGLRTTGLFVFTLFSALTPRGGGTLLVSGSHRLIEHFYRHLSPADQHLKQKPLKSRFAQSHRWLAELTGATPDAGDRIQRFMEEMTDVEGVPVKVVEITGEPGDAYLCHPALYHAASPNHADVPRFMRVKALTRTGSIAETAHDLSS